jgi:RHS repeat-associated protein
MKVYYGFLCFIICFTSKLQAQTKTEVYPQWQHPILQELRKESKNLIPFYNKDSTAFITIAVIDRKQKAIYWFDCFGYYFDAVPISEANITALNNEAITAFKYYDLITSEYLKTITKARINFQANGNVALFTKYENQLLQINDSIKFPSTLKKLIELDKQKLSIERQIREFHSQNPKKLKDDTTFSKTLALQYGAMETSFNNGDSITTYYNRIALEPVYKAILNYNNASIIYYNRANQKIDSIQFEDKKVAILRKEKTDVFLLYRGWLELNRFNMLNNFSAIKTAMKEIAKQESKIDKAQFASTKNSMQYLLNYTNQLVRIADYKIDYLTTVDRGFVTQCLKQQYRLSTNYLSAGAAYLSTFARGEKFYELTDMRGNVMAVVTDKKIAHSLNGATIDYYEADIAAATDYAPGGMPLVGRNFQSDKYRYGYNGKENDNEVKGQGNQIAYEARIYDPRLGRLLSIDPLTSKFAGYTPYQYAGNKPVWCVDLLGLQDLPTTELNEHGEKQVYEIYVSGKPKFWARGGGGTVYPNAGYQTMKPVGTAVTNNLSDKDIYRLAIARMLSSDGFKISDNEYLDEKYLKVEKSVKYYFSNLATSTMVNSPEMRNLTADIHDKVISGIFSDDNATSDASVTQIQRRTSFWGTRNIASDAVMLFGSSVAAWTKGFNVNSLRSLGVPKGFGIFADAAKFRTAATTLNEQLAIKEAMGVGGSGARTEIFKAGTLHDPKLVGMDVSKYSYNLKILNADGKVIENIEVHYLQNNKTGIKFDFKFKDK